MTLDQLRLLRELARRRFNLTAAAGALGLSQPAASKYLKDLEDHLGLELVERTSRRIVALTEPGALVLERALRVLRESEDLMGAADEFRCADEGALVIAATHTQARYALPPAILAFREAFPKVRLHLHQAAPAEIADMVVSGAADIGVATELLAECEGLDAHRFYSWRHAVVVPNDHPLARTEKLPLERLAQWPLIAYDHGLTGRGRIDAAFLAQGLSPNVVMTALDADVIKSYVALGLGVGIIAEVAFDPKIDVSLKRIAPREIFEENTSWLAVRRGRFLRGYMRQFLEIAIQRAKN